MPGPLKPSGFVTRTKGKVSFGGMTPLQELPIEYINVGTTGQGTGFSTQLYPSGISVITSTQAAVILTMGPPDPGTYKTFVFSTLSSHVCVKTFSTAAGGVFVDSTTNCMIVPSTTAAGIQTWRGLAVSTTLFVTVGFSTIGSTTLWGTSS